MPLSSHGVGDGCRRTGEKRSAQHEVRDDTAKLGAGVLLEEVAGVLDGGVLEVARVCLLPDRPLLLARATAARKRAASTGTGSSGTGYLGT